MARNVITPKGRAVQVEGLADLRKRVALVINRASGKEIKKIYMEAALVLKDQIVRNAPKKTGLLKSAVFAAYGDKLKNNVIVGINQRKAPHGHIVEFGSVHNRPRPFFRPAITSKRSEVVQRVAEGFRRVIQDTAG